MEDHWEANYRNEYLTVDRNDAYADADNDGWSNWAEARANFRTGRHSTNPLSDTSITANGNFLNEFPTPAIRLTVDYFGDQNVYTNVTADTNIVVHGYTADGNNSAPDVTYHLPLTTSRAEGDAGALGGNVAQEMGNWRSGTLAGYVHMGNVVPGSFQIAYSYVSPVSSEVEDTSLQPTFYVTDRSPDGTSAATGQLYIVSATFDSSISSARPSRTRTAATTKPSARIPSARLIMPPAPTPSTSAPPAPPPRFGKTAPSLPSSRSSSRRVNCPSPTSVPSSSRNRPPVPTSSATTSRSPPSTGTSPLVMPSSLARATPSPSSSPTPATSAKASTTSMSSLTSTAMATGTAASLPVFPTSTMSTSASTR